MRSLAIRTVMSDRARDGNVFVIDDLSFTEPSTKTVAALLKTLNVSDRKVLVVNGKTDANLYRSVRNLAKAECTTVEQLNVYQLLEAEVILVTSSGLTSLSALNSLQVGENGEVA